MHNSTNRGTAIMANSRPTTDFDFTKVFADFRFRPFDVEAVWTAQRRNLEALSQANQVAVASVQAVARHQIDLTRETFEGFSALMRDMAAPASTEDRIAKNTDYVKQMLEKGVTHGREIAAIAAKAGTEAAEVLQKRANESLDEMRALASHTANQTPTR